MASDRERREFQDRVIRRQEERDHAFSVTVGILILIAILAAGTGISYVLISRGMVPISTITETVMEQASQTENNQ